MAKKSRMKHSDATEGDIIIPVIGLNGAGKSTFINAAIGEDLAPVGHGLFSCTKEVNSFLVAHPHHGNRRIILVDTPGFDDTGSGNAEPLKCIKEWLENTYNKKRTVSGIIYLWDMSQTRDTLRPVLDIFCTPKPLRHVVVATTKWSVPPTEPEGNRCAEMKRYLKSSEVPEFMRTQKSAWDIIDRIITQKSFETKDLQALLRRLKAYSPEGVSRASEFLSLLKKLLPKGRG